jgi:hypothetical protein
MKNVFLNFPEFIRLSALALGLGIQMQVFAGTEQNTTTSSLPSLPADIAELKFRDFFVMPVGPRGPEMTSKLLAMDGRRVRIVGYMAQQQASHPGYFMLNPVPVSADEASDATAGELRATLFVQLPPAQADHVPPYRAGLLVLTGTLSVGDRDAEVGRPSLVRLQLEVPSDPLAQLQQ